MNIRADDVTNGADTGQISGEFANAEFDLDRFKTRFDASLNQSQVFTGVNEAEAVIGLDRLFLAAQQTAHGLSFNFAQCIPDCLFDACEIHPQ